MITSKILEDNQKKITDLWNLIISMLPPQPRSYDRNDNPGFWTNGKKIYCPSEAEMNMLYEFLNDMFNEFGNYTLFTGYGLTDQNHSVEDIINRDLDDFIGFYYIRLE